MHGCDRLFIGKIGNCGDSRLGSEREQSHCKYCGITTKHNVDPKKLSEISSHKRTMPEIKDAVASSSRIMAAVRAIESQRSDRLFEDPLAAQLAGDRTIAKVAPAANEYDDRGIPFVVVRTRFFDDFLTPLAVGMRQVVILGAGMDTRAFRLTWTTDAHLYELDQAQVLQTKELLLENTVANCHRHSITIDLRQSWADLLVAQGYQTQIPSVWLLEGIVNSPFVKLTIPARSSL